MRKSLLVALGGLFVISSLTPAGSETEFQKMPTAPMAALLSVSPTMDPDFGRTPLYFVPNMGQMDERVAYYVQGKDKTLFFTAEGLTLSITNAIEKGDGLSPFNVERRTAKTPQESLPAEYSAAAESWVVKLDFMGSNKHIRPVGKEETGTVVSYFKGQPEEWRPGIPACSKIVYPDLWPGIDLVYSGTVDRLKYEFIVHPGADPSEIRLAYRGVESVSVDEKGSLQVATPLGGFNDDAPTAYQESGNEKHSVSIAYKLEAEDHVYGFKVGEYDHGLPLVLDPAILVFCGYVGGTNFDYGEDIAACGSDGVYVTGYTKSTPPTFPVTSGPDLTHNGDYDVFVARFNTSGTVLVYCGYIGGSGSDYGYGLAVDGDGNAYVTGTTNSSEATFPVKNGPDLTHNGDYDTFVAKLNSSGGLGYCGYIGGSLYDGGYAIAVDNTGSVYITGESLSTEATFPVTSGPDLTHNGDYDAFVAKLNSSGTALAYCGYIGGASIDSGERIVVEGAGNTYVIGNTGSSEATFPATLGPDLTYNGGTRDVFVAKINASGTALAYCGYIGGSSNDSGTGIAVDGSGNAYISGYTASTEATFPVTVGPDLTYNGGTRDVFVAKINASGTALCYCGFIGGSGDDLGYGLALDALDNAYLSGYTYSTEATFPVTVGPDLSHNGGADILVAKVNASGTGLIYCGYIGGSSDDLGRGIAVDDSGTAYVTGYTSSTQATFPVKTGPDLTHNGNTDVFMAKVSYWDPWAAKHAVGDFDGDGQDEAAVDFGMAGIFLYDAGAWTQLSASDPESLMAADVDGDNTDELLADLGPTGLWLWNAGAWSQLSGMNTDSMAAGDVDADGADELVGDFGAVGMWLYNGGAWSQLSGVNGDYIGCANLDGSGGEEIVGDFGSTGLWIWNTGAWTQLSGVNADYMIFGVAPGGARKDLVGDFGSFGLWLWSGILGWTQLSGLNADFMVPMQADVDAQDELVCDFGDVGMWFWDDGVWDQNSGANAEYMIIMDVDNDGIDEGAVDFGPLGLWLGSTSGGWAQLSGVDPEYMMAGDFDGDYDDEFLADFGSLGLWLWDDGAWSQISASNPD